jgi:cytochrome c oxidase subunit 1
MLYFTMFILGYEGMPRRYWDYLPEYQTLHIISTIGSWILIAGLLTMFINLFRGLRKGREAGINPWGGRTLEWTIESPPIVENFEVIPTITHGPYDYSVELETKNE